MQETSNTLDAFIERQGITFTADVAESNPHMADMPSGSTHWLVTLTKGEASMAVPYSQGPGITNWPSVEDVLECLASDSASIENATSFDDWATEMGYFPMESSEDYQKARSTWDAVNQQADELRELLGGEAFETLLWDTDR